jgi:FkbM family methyltransferase
MFNNRIKSILINLSFRSTALNIRNRFIFFISKSGITILKTKKLNYYLELDYDRKKLSREFALLNRYGIRPNIDYSQIRANAKSQIGQDMWVAFSSGFKERGTFMEIGAADGINLSNTYMLEQCFNWTGVCIEPARIWHTNFRTARNCLLETRCCSSTDNLKINFFESQQPLLSTATKYRFVDTHAHERAKGVEYTVQSVSLNTLFQKYFPAGHVNYLSIDTEGSEEEILSTFDFSKYSFDFASIEIGFDDGKRKRIQALLVSNGYRKVWSEISEFDDFYERVLN